MTTRWYKVLAPCPRCQRLPAVSLPEWLFSLARASEPDIPVIEVQCQRNTCRDPSTGRRTTYVVAADAIQRGEPIIRAQVTARYTARRT